MLKPSETAIVGSGFIGRHLVQRLARAGVRVTVAVRSPSAAPTSDCASIKVSGA